MTWRSRTLVVALAICAWWIIAWVRATSRPPDGPGDGPASGAPAPVAAQPRATSPAPIPRGSARPVKIPFLAAEINGEVTITGRVFDVLQQEPVGNVEVVFRSPAGETSTTTRGDGGYSIRLPTGMYRAFVHDDTVLSIGRPSLVRLPGRPSADAAGVPDEALMVMVLATADTEGVDLTVVRGGIVSGRVIDRGGRAIAGVVLRARGGGMRPTLATDITETGPGGSFELRLPAGAFDLDADHPNFAGIAAIADTAQSRIAIKPGDHLQTTITLTAGCVISGRVVGKGGKPAGDGAIERQWGPSDFEYAAAGRIEPDGTFRWVTTDEVDVTIRAWPWKSPPSHGQRFTCRDGARFDDVVFQLADRRPDLSGVLVDSSGAPVGLTYVDLRPLDPGGVGQQERTDAAGRWEVYNVPPGRYRVVAQADGRGVTSQTIASPHDDVRLTLGGTGRLEGTTTVATGSFELLIGTCIDTGSPGTIALPQSRRVVIVTNSRFAIDDLPACELSFGVLWRGRRLAEHVAIPSAGTAHLALDLGQPHA
jgi:hypothetical protein